jgi:Ni,Fe-hydrogenase III large subunit
MLLLLEAYESLRLALTLLDELPSGACIGERIEIVPPGSGEAEVEAPSYPLRYRVTSDGTRATELEITARGAPSRLVWRAMLAGNLVDDAAIIVASAAPCCTCNEQ